MKKPIYKRFWFWLLVVCTAVSIVVSQLEDTIANPSVSMEVVLYAIIPMLCGISMVAVVICLLSLLVKKLQKKDTQRTQQRLMVSFLCVVATFIVFFAYPMDENTPNSSDDSLDGETEQTGNSESENKEMEIGEAKSRPFVLTTTELSKEIEADVDAAKEKYSGKWIQVTGEISDTSDGGVVYGYYIYGESITNGYRGLKIICWCEDGPYSGSVLGDTRTFLGRVSEVSTVNSTEIIDCEIVK